MTLRSGRKYLGVNGQLVSKKRISTKRNIPPMTNQVTQETEENIIPRKKENDISKKTKMKNHPITIPIAKHPNLPTNQVNHPNYPPKHPKPPHPKKVEETEVKAKIKELFANKKYYTSYSKYLKQLFDKLDVPSKFKRRLKKFPRRKTIVHGPFNTYQMDLIEYRNLKYSNNGCKYILTIIDCFTRFGFAYPLKSKTAENTADQILKFLESLNNVPRFIYSDAGKEFENSKVQSIFKARGILHFILKNGPKASIVERFNKTIKSSLGKFINLYFLL